jgi:hypothetical protein
MLGDSRTRLMSSGMPLAKIQRAIGSARTGGVSVSGCVVAGMQGEKRVAVNGCKLHSHVTPWMVRGPGVWVVRRVGQRWGLAWDWGLPCAGVLA